ncbi:flagellar export protein FliJ [Galbitalea soli]|uniref:Flagellar export protein FliJ n=1 Tax=Galbitalea soli TaxID=1268042 RepID=A0A7C9TQ43_9MICO|nr:flagellar export protein FliJ [Galbitalea soli]NEM91177.1 flagellar export protein FliJ [Galbitalea soli]NYJ29866.1 flagellar FliJ protein [Galbitalea soli]
MSTAFSLEGLLRLRRLQKDQAAAEVAQARNRAADTLRRKRQARDLLSLTEIEHGSVDTVHSIAAARASSASMLADLTALEEDQRVEVERARVAHAAAHGKALGLEKLEARHGEASALAALRADQIVIDEVSARAWHLAQGEVTP